MVPPNFDRDAAPDAVPRPRLAWPDVRRFVIRRFIALVVLLALYTLSIGPMWWMWYSGMYLETETNYWVIAAYEPLRQACRVEIINDIVTAYIVWWNL